VTYEDVDVTPPPAPRPPQRSGANLRKLNFGKDGCWAAMLSPTGQKLRRPTVDKSERAIWRHELAYLDYDQRRIRDATAPNYYGG